MERLLGRAFARGVEDSLRRLKAAAEARADQRRALRPSPI